MGQIRSRVLQRRRRLVRLLKPVLLVLLIPEVLTYCVGLTSLPGTSRWNPAHWYGGLNLSRCDSTEPVRHHQRGFHAHLCVLDDIKHIGMWEVSVSPCFTLDSGTLFYRYGSIDYTYTKADICRQYHDVPQNYPAFVKKERRRFLWVRASRRIPCPPPPRWNSQGLYGGSVYPKQ